MLIEKVEEKLQEACLFLKEMAAREQRAFGDRKEFAIYLSAFLTAGRSARSKLEPEEGGSGKFYREWVKSLSANEQELMKFMQKDRNLEVHQVGHGSRHYQKESRTVVQGHYEDESGRMFAHTPVGTPPTEIAKSTYFFRINGSEIPVLECGRKYVELLERLVREYRQDAGL